MAYLMFANADGTIQNWGVASAQVGVTVYPAEIAGEGNYSVSLEFAQPSDGIGFAAIGIKNGEKTYPGYIIQATDVLINEVTRCADRHRIHELGRRAGDPGESLQRIG